MRHTKQEKQDFQADKKALKKEIKLAKKGISNTKKHIKKQEKLIKKTEVQLGKQYYRERVMRQKPLMYTCDELCGVIRRAEDTTREKQAVLDVLDLRLLESKEKLRSRTAAYKKSGITEVILDQPS